MTFILKREDVAAAGGRCKLKALLDERAVAGFADENGDIVYPDGFTSAEALRIFKRAPEALYWLERRELVPVVDFKIKWNTIRFHTLPRWEMLEPIRAYFLDGPERLERYRARKAEARQDMADRKKQARAKRGA